MSSKAHIFTEYCIKNTILYIGSNHYIMSVEKYETE